MEKFSINETLRTRATEGQEKFICIVREFQKLLGIHSETSESMGSVAFRLDETAIDVMYCGLLDPATMVVTVEFPPPKGAEMTMYRTLLELNALSLCDRHAYGVRPETGNCLLIARLPVDEMSGEALIAYLDHLTDAMEAGKKVLHPEQATFQQSFV